ncbi:helix-turn-helix domain-containing protein [Limosilactobacillus gastricus]|uniref:helix-turn-helix domain-containing protein n=1 Tax=Limosilactobacillus gastricus TaxID=227942 RepID=UPI0026EA4A60|nr:helix-turn-helix domain-containing protein [Limosilactobacillus gastricus]
MELNGAKFREIRRERGLSQIDLSEGICTQATISLIENSNRIPKLEILNQLVDRLDVPLSAILVVDRLDNVLLEQITNSMYQNKLGEVNHLLEEIDSNSLDGDDLTRYYYLMGFKELRQGNYDDAIYNLGLVLTQLSVNSSRQDYWPAVYYGFAAAYSRKGDLDKAQEMVDRSMKDLTHFMEGARHRNYGFWLAISVAQLQLELNQPDKSLQVCQAIIKVALNKRQLSPLGKAYHVMGQVNLSQGDSQLARENITIANSFAKVLKDQVELKETAALLDSIKD